MFILSLKMSSLVSQSNYFSQKCIKYTMLENLFSASCLSSNVYLHVVQFYLTTNTVDVGGSQRPQIGTTVNDRAMMVHSFWVTTSFWRPRRHCTCTPNEGLGLYCYEMSIKLPRFHSVANRPTAYVAVSEGGWCCHLTNYVKPLYKTSNHYFSASNQLPKQSHPIHCHQLKRLQKGISKSFIIRLYIMTIQLKQFVCQLNFFRKFFRDFFLCSRLI